MLFVTFYLLSILISMYCLVVIYRRDEEIRKLENIISGLKSELSKYKVYEHVTREIGDLNIETIANSMEELYDIVKKAKVVLNLSYLNINEESHSASIQVTVQNKSLLEKVYVCTFNTVDKLAAKNFEYYVKIREYTIQQHKKMDKRWK